MSIYGGAIVPHPPLIIPEVGHGQENKIVNTINAYKEVAKKVKEASPTTIIIISPHSDSYIDSFRVFANNNEVGSLKKFGAPSVTFNVQYDEEFIDRLSLLAVEKNFPLKKETSPQELDHGVMVPLYFINQEYSNYKIVRLSLSGFSSEKHYELGLLLKQVIKELNKKYYVIASGDLSHRLKEDGPYGFAEEGPTYDKKIVSDISSCNFKNLFTYDKELLNNAGICGHRGFCIMGGIFAGLKLEPHLLSYEGPFGVGYAVCTYKVREDEYIALARNTIENYIKHGIIIDKRGASPELLNNKAGVFVTIYKNGFLRGCIGRIFATKNSLAEEIITNAISSATKDPRFHPITEEELPYLEISVDVLKEKEKITSTEELDVDRYGLIVSSGLRRGLLLPNLDNVRTIEDQLRIALEKGGIKEDEDYTMERFEVIRHEQA